MTESSPHPLLRLEGISKSFGGAPVLTGVSFDVLAGEVHALTGENGAGKSTLMNIVSGVLRPDSGRMEWAGVPVAVPNPRAAQDLGISFVHQELALVPQLSIAENVFLGRHPSRRICLQMLGLRWQPLGMLVVKWGELRERARELMAELGHHVDPRTPVEELSIGERQLVEIARALARVSRLIIMDEPTAPLSEHETERLFEVIGRLRSRGVSIIYITHRLKEVYTLADRVTVLRDGRRIATGLVSGMPRDVLVRHMVGRELSEEAAEPRPAAQADAVLQVEGLARGRDFRDISFEVRSGEIVALAGLVGAGRTEVLESLFGVSPATAGRVSVDGREVSIRTPADAIRSRIALVPDDRKTKGLIPGASVRANMVLASKRQFVIHTGEEAASAARMIGELRVRARDAEAPVSQLSGGNQQKVVLAKWLLAEASVFLLDEPTRGVDVGAKTEIYLLIRAMARRGAAILFASSELEEVLRLADRILVMHRGRIAGQLSRAEASEEHIMQIATGGDLAPGESS